MINGIINVYKEAGFTSHDVVAKLRGILRQKKIGHTGTLDPDATGVLPVCLGKATRLCDLIGNWIKSYEAVLLLGQTTDTEDSSGQVLSTSPVQVNEEEIRRILQSFVGPYDQVPPMYSAKKQKGRRLYELARAGITVERPPCRVQVYEIDIKDISLPRVSFTVTCSKGTYIRSLCRDAGEMAGCGGCMEKLVRTGVADFSLEESCSLDRIKELVDQNRISEIIRPIDSLYQALPALIPTGDGIRLLMNGNPIPYRYLHYRRDDLPDHKNSSGDLPELFSKKTPDPERAQIETDENIRGNDSDTAYYRLYDPEGHFIGLYMDEPALERLKPYKLFFDLQE